MKHSTLNVRGILSSRGSVNSGGADLPAATLEMSHGSKGQRWMSLRTLAMVVGIFILSIVTSSNVFSQDVPTATLSENGVIQLPTDQPLSGSYLFDLSGMSFSSDEQMTNFLSTKAGDHFIVRALPNLDKGVVMLKRGDKPLWTCSDWNAYLNGELVVNPITAESLQQMTNE